MLRRGLEVDARRAKGVSQREDPQRRADALRDRPQHVWLIVAFNFRAQIAFIKFIGTHAQYDKVDALTVSQF